MTTQTMTGVGRALDRLCENADLDAMSETPQDDGDTRRIMELESAAALVRHSSRLMLAAERMAALLKDFIDEGEADEMCRFCEDESWYGDGHSSSCLIGCARSLLEDAHAV